MTLTFLEQFERICRPARSGGPVSLPDHVDLPDNVSSPSPVPAMSPATITPEPLTLDELERLLGVELELVEPDFSGDDAETWDLIFEKDRRELLNPPVRFPACSWCGGYAYHAADCFGLDSQGPMRMPFGKHRDTPLALLPREYLSWLLANAGADFETALSQKRKCPPLSPEMLQEIRRLLHAGKHDYQPGTNSWENRRTRNALSSSLQGTSND